MFFLAGLLGMMALGSVAIVSTGFLDEDDDAQAVTDTGESHETGAMPEGALGDMISSAIPFDDAGFDALPPETPEAAPGMTSAGSATVPAGDNGGLSLFARMGLINLPGLGQDDAAGDSLTGTDATDFLRGTDADDAIDGAGGADDLRGGAGADTLDGGAGADTMHGEEGDDLMHGDAGDDTLYGHDGADMLDGGDGADALLGGLGDDALRGGAGDDALHGREGDDSLEGGPGQDTLFGAWGNDHLSGVVADAAGRDTDGGDFLNGGDGDDTLVAGNADVLHGGEGSDVLVLGQWMTGGAAAELVDFDALEDQLIVIFDDSAEDVEPEVEIRLSAADPAVTEIVMNGAVLGTLPTADAPGPEGLVLVGESVAASMGLA